MNTPELAPRQRMWLHLISFAYKKGIPPEADMVLDVRFLPNPYFVEELQPLTGENPGVRKYVLERPETQAFLDHLFTFVDFLLPQLPGRRQDASHPGHRLHRRAAPLGGHRQRPGRSICAGKIIRLPLAIAICRGPQENSL